MAHRGDTNKVRLHHNDWRLYPFKECRASPLVTIAPSRAPHPFPLTMSMTACNHSKLPLENKKRSKRATISGTPLCPFKHDHMRRQSFVCPAPSHFFMHMLPQTWNKRGGVSVYMSRVINVHVRMNDTFYMSKR